MVDQQQQQQIRMPGFYNSTFSDSSSMQQMVDGGATDKHMSQVNAEMNPDEFNFAMNHLQINGSQNITPVLNKTKIPADLYDSKNQN